MRNWIFAMIGVMCMGSAPFDYDLHLTALPGKSPKTMICFHGSGANYKLIEFLKDHVGLEETLVGFNFPDHDFANKDPKSASFGSIRELLPALYVLKTYVIDKGMDQIDLYGFSAGGGAVINTIAILNTSLYDQDLEKIGISMKEKRTILQAIQKGRIILDAPLKSVEEIIEFRGPSEDLVAFAHQYSENGLRPIDSLKYLINLSLHITLYFENPDEILSNRDDDLFIERLQKYNSKGTTKVIIGSDGGHSSAHSAIWK